MCKAIEEMIKESNEKTKKESVIEAFKSLARDWLLSPEVAASRAGAAARIQTTRMYFKRKASRSDTGGLFVSGSNQVLCDNCLIIKKNNWRYKS